MNLLKCKIGVALLVFIFVGYSVSAKEFYQKVKKKSPITNNGLVDLSNTRGTIDIRTWNKNQVSIDVVITVNARNQSDADEVFDRIKINFDKSQSTVSAHTEIQKIPKWNWNYVRSEYTVDYIVYMPKTCNLNLFNKYGDALIADLAGKVTLSVQYGNIRIKNINNRLKLNLKYGNCTVMKAANSDITMVHGNIRLKKANNINFFTSYSKVSVDEAGDIKSKSINDTYKLGIVNEFRNIGKYDKIEIQEVKNIIVVSKFTDFKIGVVTKSADFDMVHGNVTISKVSQGFSEVLMVGESTDYQLHIEKGSDYKMEATAQNTSLNFPKKSTVVCQDKLCDEQKIQFYVGSKINPFSYIKARIVNGGISVK